MKLFVFACSQYACLWGESGCALESNLWKTLVWKAADVLPELQRGSSGKRRCLRQMRDAGQQCLAQSPLQPDQPSAVPLSGRPDGPSRRPGMSARFSRLLAGSNLSGADRPSWTVDGAGRPRPPLRPGSAFSFAPGPYAPGPIPTGGDASRRPWLSAGSERRPFFCAPVRPRSLSAQAWLRPSSAAARSRLRPIPAGL